MKGGGVDRALAALASVMLAGRAFGPTTVIENALRGHRQALSLSQPRLPAVFRGGGGKGRGKRPHRRTPPRRPRMTKHGIPKQRGVGRRW